MFGNTPYGSPVRCLLGILALSLMPLASPPHAQNLLATLTGHSNTVSSVSFSPDGQVLASGSVDETIKLWDVGSRREIATLKGHSGLVYSVSFSPDGQVLASGSDDHTIKLWDVGSRREIATLKGHRYDVYSVSFSPDGQVLASGGSAKTIKLWDVGSRREIATLRGHSNTVNSVSFSPDGQVLASGSFDKTIKLWDVGSRREIATLKGHSNWVRSVSFSPDGQVLASGSFDDTIKLWDVGSRREIATLKGHSSNVRSVSFSPDGQVLASGSLDNTIKLWDVGSRREIATLKGHSGRVYSVSFSPDGQVLASGSFDDTIKLWDVAAFATPHMASAAKPQETSTLPPILSIGPIAALPRDEDPAPERVQIEDLPDLEIDVRQDIPKTGMKNPKAILPPILSIEAITFSEGVLDAEERAALNIHIKNVGPGDARNVSVELLGVDVSQGLSFPASTKVPTIAKAGGEQVVEIPIIGEHALPTGMASLDIHVIEPQFKQKIRGKRLRFQTRAFRAPQLVMTDVAVVEKQAAAPNNRIDLNEMFDLKFYVQNRGVGAAEDVSVKVENDQKGVEWLGVTNAEGTKKISPKFSAIDAGEYELVTYSYFVNSEFTASELRFTIRTTERRGQYGFVETKTAAINTELEPLGQIAVLPRDEDPAPERVQIEDPPDLEIDVRKNIPETGMKNPKAIAVVIGNRNYDGRDVPAVDFALADASIIKAYLIQTLGYKENNVLYYTNATKGTFESVFGNENNHKGKLFYRADPKGQSDLFIYYSGHGAPDIQSSSEKKASYLVPVDADPSNVRFGGYALDVLCNNLRQIPHRRVTVVIDACFSGMSDGGRLMRDISPLGLPSQADSRARLPEQSTMIFTAAGSRQVASWYRDKQHSLFTYFFLKALRGDADADENKVLTAAEISDYVSDQVLSIARRHHSRDQNPEFIGNKDAVMVQY